MAVEHEMVGQCHWLIGHEFEQILIVEDSGAWRATVPEVTKELGMTEWLNNNKAFHNLGKFFVLPFGWSGEN